MVSTAETHERLHKLLRRRHVATLDVLFEALGTRSRMTVFRRLREMGYHSSFTHRGRYYTLEEIPRFDEEGLWFYDDVGFSQPGHECGISVNLLSETVEPARSLASGIGYTQYQSTRWILLDHILLSPSLYWGALRNARIEHEAFEEAIDPSASGRMHQPSDHRPVTASLEF